MTRSRKPHPRGVAAVEFAVVAPVFFLVVLGIIEFGRMVMVQQVITNAAREGARIAVLDSATTARVETRVTDYLNSANLRGSSVTITPNPPTLAGFDQPVSVQVDVPFAAVSALSRPFLAGSRTLTATAVMRRETSE
ncbi:TadE/TadG family type IV pilus assembly protein [Botrimarina hoheduenensis]|uniref:TadE-like protein n=1 Tax=Botrimarina hoheduenensis TaxID=2528000 RepID=A0A5C5VZE7_9BACT|nr:TadE/TadG family type IV pilus assembly protein [Botrimarina hoheduenensis]TWT43375.1 TadE-like protein [Botrimarina hoheduenensis]